MMEDVDYGTICGITIPAIVLNGQPNYMFSEALTFTIVNFQLAVMSEAYQAWQ